MHAALHTVKVVENHDTSFVFEGVRYTVQGGLYQKQNAALALAAAKYLGAAAAGRFQTGTCRTGSPRSPGRAGLKR